MKDKFVFGTFYALLVGLYPLWVLLSYLFAGANELSKRWENVTLDVPKEPRGPPNDPFHSQR